MKNEPPEIRRYRILIEHDFSVSVEKENAFPVRIGRYDCEVFWKPRYSDPVQQRNIGGGLLHLQYESTEKDMIRAAALGHRLVEDLLAGLSVVSGVPFGTTRLIQLVDITESVKSRFLLTVTPKIFHWDKPIGEQDLEHLQRLLLHFDESNPDGTRIQRAAWLYRRGLLEEEDLASFQYCYMGLEALEKPLANMQGVMVGAEEVKGHCDHCGHEFVKKRTVLNGVRAYILKGIHGVGADHGVHGTGAGPDNSVREREWRKINQLRQKLFHSLKDRADLDVDAPEAASATAYVLHEAISCLSHVHELESDEYSVFRGGRGLIYTGTAEPGIADTLEECRYVVDFQGFKWVPHEEFEWVPEIRFDHSRPGTELQGKFFWPSKDLGIGSEADLKPANWESINP